MKTLKWQNLILFLITFSFLYNCQGRKDNADEISLWPEIEPLESGYLKVSEIHEIYYELCGNPQGKPVFVIHGGPGAGCSPYMRQFFNPDKFLIVLHDQRGCGKSRPNADKLLRLMQSEDRNDREKYAKMGSRYEYKACGLNVNEESFTEWKSR